MIKYLTSNTLISQLVLMIASLGSIYGFYTYGFTSNTIGLTFLGYFLYMCVGISITFHRLLCHRSFKTYNWFAMFGTFMGTVSNTGSSIVWTAIHMNHHKNSDTTEDPHSPHHQGIKTFVLDYKLDITKTKWKLRHLIGDPFHMFLHKYYFAVIAAWSLLLFLIGGLELMIFLHWAPVVLSALMSNITNYVAHHPNWIGGYRRYNVNDLSTNNWLWAIPTWGETIHNNHHKHPYKWSHSERWWEVDIGSYIIRLIKKG